MSLYLIRHGETAWSISGQHTGRTDIPLTARGEQEAQAIGEGLRAVTFCHVFTSPRQRARRTCELVGLDAALEIEPGLVEWDYGDYEGQRSVDIRTQRPDWNLFRDGCPHGESPSAVSDRADRLITQLRALQGNIAVFSHGHFGRVLAARWIGLPVSQAQHLILSTASVSILGYEQNSTEQSAIELWNAVPSNTADSGPNLLLATTRRRLERESHMPIQLNEENGGKMLVVHVSGKLAAADYEHFVPEFDRLVRAHGRLRVLFDMTGFHGWTAGALWEDTKFAMHHFRDIDRLAVVGETKWQEGMATFCRPFTNATIRYFDHADASGARTWLGEA